MISETDKAWIAGVIDTRGRITLDRKASPTGFYTLRICVARDSLMQRIHEMTEVRRDIMRGRSYDRKGCMEHCEEAHIHVIHKDSIDLRVPVGKTVIILHNVSRYLHSERARANLAIWAFSTNLYAGKSKAWRIAVPVMESLGWDIPEEMKDDE
jgi:hypothetical protein